MKRRQPQWQQLQESLAASERERARLADELERTREQLRQVQATAARAARLSSTVEWTAGIAHEIRNPLSAIGNCIEILSKTLKLEGEDKELIDIALSECERLHRVITDFLSFARPKQPDRRPTDVRQLLDKTLTLLQRDTRYVLQVQLIRRYGESMPEVFIDSDQLSQVFWNLTLNAVQAMPNGGQLVLETMVEEALLDGEKQRCLCVTVRDNGPGMPEEVKRKALRPFFTTKASGTGLGLAIVHQIVEAHDGVMLIESAEGEGTEIKILLPLKQG